MTIAPKKGAPRGSRVPQQARSRRTRERILRAAVACFEERGFDATTTAGIARRAGIAVGTLYGYFADKRELLLEVMAETLEQVADPVVRGLEPSAWRAGSARENVRRLIDTVFRARTVTPGLQRILWERYFKDPQFRSAFEAVEDRVRVVLQALLEALRAEGRCRVSDAPAAAFVLYNSVEWTAARLMLGEVDEARVDAAVEATTDMVTRFLFGDVVD